jgi:Tfp pilus assembly protein PilP
MKVKRLFCLLLICLVVVSCGTDEVQEEFDETPNQPKETLTQIKDEPLHKQRKPTNGN